MATIITAENFTEELAPFPGWVLRNLMLLRHLDEKETSLRTLLNEAHTKYLKDQQAIPAKKKIKLSPEDLSRLDEVTNDPLLKEIVSLQRQCVSLSHEKLAIVAKLESLVKGTQESLIQACSAIPQQDVHPLHGNMNESRSEPRRRSRAAPASTVEDNRATRSSVVRASSTTQKKQKTGSQIGVSTGGVGSDFILPLGGAPGGAASSVLYVEQSNQGGFPPSFMGGFDGSQHAHSQHNLTSHQLHIQPQQQQQPQSLSLQQQHVNLDGASSCPLCDMPDDELMVLCDGCQEWFHYRCASYTPPVEPSDEPFFCSHCALKSNGGRSQSGSHNSNNQKRKRSKNTISIDL